MVNAHDDCLQGAGPDERLTLPTEQGVLLWCMRMWVIGMKRGVAAEARIDEMLDAIGAGSASGCLKRFMHALSHGCTRMIEVRCVCCKRISLDERALLDVVSLTQAMRPFEARLVLRGFTTQAGAGAALCGAEGIALALREAGCFLPEPQGDMRQLALSGTDGAVRPMGATLH
jgi:hypothetical protein